MVDQFEQFQTQYQIGCAITASGRCGQPYEIWPVFLYPTAIALAMLLYWLSGSSSRVAVLAERVSRRRFWQAVIVSLPLWLLWTLICVAIRLWGFWSNGPTCPVRTDGICIGGTSSWGQAAWQAITPQLWLLPVATLLCFVAVRLFSRWPRWFWLFPAMLWIAYASWPTIVPQTRIRPIDSGPMADIVRTLARQEGIDPSRIGTARGIIGKNDLDGGRVLGIGGQQYIVLGMSHVFEHDFSLFYLKLRPDNFDVRIGRAILSHELAHVRLNHALYRLSLAIILILVIIFISWQMLFRRWANLRRDPRSAAMALYIALPLLIVLGCVVMSGHQIILRSFLLYQEMEADRVGLDIGRDPDSFAKFALLSAIGERFELTGAERWLTYHPSNADRIRTAIAWQQRHRPERPLVLPNVRRLLAPRRPALPSRE